MPIATVRESTTKAPLYTAGTVREGQGVYDEFQALQAANVAVGATWQTITKTVLGADTATVAFSSIPSSFSGLAIFVQARNSSAASNGYLFMQVGTGGTLDTGANYAYVNQLSNTGAVTYGESFSSTGLFVCQQSGAASVASRASKSVIFIPNYKNTTFWKCILTKSCFAHGDAAANFTEWGTCANWKNTGAINIIQLAVHDGTNFKQNSIFHLMGIP